MMREEQGGDAALSACTKRQGQPGISCGLLHTGVGLGPGPEQDLATMAQPSRYPSDLLRLGSRFGTQAVIDMQNDQPIIPKLVTGYLGAARSQDFGEQQQQGDTIGATGHADRARRIGPTRPDAIEPIRQPFGG
jgi:hypothetical protein